jgi:PBP1b-binding outer membrane lipoprotein LpoB
MRCFTLLVALAAVIVLGCHKKEAPPTAQSDSTQSTTTQSQNQPLAGEVNPDLTAALRQYAQKNGRIPQSFREFARAALDSTPPPPQGKKWEIDPADTTVKAVPNK